MRSRLDESFATAAAISAVRPRLTRRIASVVVSSARSQSRSSATLQPRISRCTASSTPASITRLTSSSSSGTTGMGAEIAEGQTRRARAWRRHAPRASGRRVRRARRPPWARWRGRAPHERNRSGDCVRAGGPRAACRRCTRRRPASRGEWRLRVRRRAATTARRRARGPRPATSARSCGRRAARRAPRRRARRSPGRPRGVPSGAGVGEPESTDQAGVVDQHGEGQVPIADEGEAPRGRLGGGQHDGDAEVPAPADGVREVEHARFARRRPVEARDDRDDRASRHGAGRGRPRPRSRRAGVKAGNTSPTAGPALGSSSRRAARAHSSR